MFIDCHINNFTSVPMLQRGNAYHMGVPTLEHGNQAS